MATSFVGFDAITASTDDPVGMLAACHTRVRKQCATIKALIPHLRAKGADDEAAAAAHRVMRYFDEAAQHHHADEEEDLFPSLIQAASLPENLNITPDVAELCDRLRTEHASMGKLWQELRAYLIRVRAHQLPSLDPMGPLVEQFTEAYEAHTAFEDAKLLPLARKLLKTSALASLGQQMKARRQSG